MVVDFLQFSGLFQTCVLVVDDVDKFFVIADDSEFAGRDVYLVEGDAVESEFLNLMAEGDFSTDVVLVFAMPDAGECLLRRVELCGNFEVCNAPMSARAMAA